MTVEFHDKRAAAGKAIRKILIDLEEDSGQKIEAVQVDMHEFSNLRVDIFFVEEATNDSDLPTAEDVRGILKPGAEG